MAAMVVAWAARCSLAANPVPRPVILVSRGAAWAGAARIARSRATNTETRMVVLCAVVPISLDSTVRVIGLKQAPVLTPIG